MPSFFVHLHEKIEFVLNLVKNGFRSITTTNILDLDRQNTQDEIDAEFVTDLDLNFQGKDI